MATGSPIGSTVLSGPDSREGESQCLPHNFGKNSGEACDWSLTGHIPIPGPITLTRGSDAVTVESGIMCPLLDIGGVNSSKSHKLNRIAMEQGVCVCMCVYTWQI